MYASQSAVAVRRRREVQVYGMLDHYRVNFGVLGYMTVIGVPAGKAISVQTHFAFVGIGDIRRRHVVLHRLLPRRSAVGIEEYHRECLFSEYRLQRSRLAYRPVAPFRFGITVRPTHKLIPGVGNGSHRRRVFARNYFLDEVALYRTALARYVCNRQRRRYDLENDALFESAEVQNDVRRSIRLSQIESFYQHFGQSHLLDAPVGILNGRKYVFEIGVYRNPAVVFQNYRRDNGARIPAVRDKFRTLMPVDDRRKHRHRDARRHQCGNDNYYRRYAEYAPSGVIFSGDSVTRHIDISLTHTRALPRNAPYMT